MSDSVRPHRRQPTRLPHPWDSLGKNTGVGCHFLLQGQPLRTSCKMNTISPLLESEVAQSCPTLRDPMDCSLPGSSVHGIFLARVLEWIAMPSSKRSFQSKDRTHVFCISFIVGRFLSTTREVQRSLTTLLLLLLLSGFSRVRLCAIP